MSVFGGALASLLSLSSGSVASVPPHLYADLLDGRAICTLMVLASMDRRKEQ